VDQNIIILKFIIFFKNVKLIEVLYILSFLFSDVL